MTPTTTTYRNTQEKTIEIRTHELLVSALAEQGLLRAYAHFIKLKYTFTAGRVNKGNRAQLSRSSGVPERTVRMYMKQFEKLGWVRKDRKDLVFCNLKTLYRKSGLQHNRLTHSTMIQASSHDDARVLEARLAAILVAANLTRQGYLMKKKRDFQSHSGALEAKGTKKTTGQRKCPSGNARTKLSVQKFGSLVGKKKTAGALLKKKLLFLNLIQCEKNIRQSRAYGILPSGRKMYMKVCMTRQWFSKDRNIVFTREVDFISMRTPHAYGLTGKATTMGSLQKSTFSFLHGVSRWKPVRKKYTRAT